MKNKYTLFLICSLLVSVVSFGQTIQEKIEAQGKNPKRVEDAAKADVYITKNKSIADRNGSYDTTNAIKQKSSVNKTKKKKLKKS